MVDLLPVPRAHLTSEPIVLRHLVPDGTRDSWEDYELPDAVAILRALEASPLEEHGGSGLPVAPKWHAARAQAGGRRWVVANGDEGDPGSYVDRLLLEEDPHAVLAGMLACARAIGATHGIVYVRGEYPRALRTVRAAILEARRRGALGTGFEVEAIAGAGSYVCGEDNALLRSIEGLRGEPSPRPPQPAERGLFGEPTVVHNVETFAAAAWVARHARPSGTRAVCVGGAVRRPGVVEVVLGTSLREVLVQGAGGPAAGRTWGMALVGGPTGRVLPAAEFDTALSNEALPGMGHAGVVVLDDTVTPRALAEHLMTFARKESCGACAPCRIGSAKLAGARERTALERLLTTMEMGSLCAFGSAVPRPLRDLLRHFGAEVLR
jgi:NADH:ubiquinone oxidoreductase subunit F (NADH-binding)